MSHTKDSRNRVLVVGAAGFLGRHIVNRLIRGKFEVSAQDLFKPATQTLGVDWIVGSASDESLLSAAVSGCANVIYLAANSLPASANSDMASEISRHVKTAVKAAEICASQNVQTFIFASSGGTVYGASHDNIITEDTITRPLNAYGASKVAIENYLYVLSKIRGMRTLSLRISNPFGVGQKAHRAQGFIAAAMASAFSGDVLHCWGDGSVVRDFIYVEDVAEAFFKSCSYKGPPSTINIGSGRGRSLLEVIESIEEITKIKIEIEFNLDRIFDVDKNILDISLASRALEWAPKIPFEDGLQRTADWWNEMKLKS